MPGGLPAGVQPFALAALTPEPWRNGGGSTRTIAATQVGGVLQWRVSAADITRPGPFSVFEGLDRTAVLMSGPGLALQGRREQWVFEGIGARAHFPGELPLHAVPGAGGSARLCNVMVARDRWRADVQVHRGAGGPIAAQRAAVLVVLDGALLVSGEDASATPLRRGPEEGLVLSDLAQPLLLRAVDDRAQWVTVSLSAC